MIRRLRRKGVVALLAAVTTVVVIAASAAADVSEDGEIEAATFNVNNGEYEFEFPNENGDGPDCTMPAAPDPPTVTVEFTNEDDPNAGDSDTEVTDIDVGTLAFQDSLNVWWAMNLSVSSLSLFNDNLGTTDGTGGNISTDLELIGDVDSITNPSASGQNCTFGASNCVALIGFNGMSGSWSHTSWGPPVQAQVTSLAGDTSNPGGTNTFNCGGVSGFANALAGGVVASGMNVAFPA